MTNMPASPYTILLVEDNLAHAELVKYSFRAQDAANEVIHLTDGEDALNYLFRRGPYAEDAESPRPHVILLDLHLPCVDGLDVLKEIKSCEALRGIPVVILTTSAADCDVAHAYQEHANSFIVKPIKFVQFQALIEEISVYWLSRNYPPPSSLAA